MNTKEMIEDSMDREEIKKIMQAYIDGEAIQVKSYTDGKWYDLKEDYFNFDKFLHRIKPKATLEDRVKAEYSGFDVVMLGELEWWIYEIDGILERYAFPTIHKNGKIILPIAELFTRAGE